MNLHSCHWPGCEKVVSNRLWACSQHWFLLPKTIRSQLKIGVLPEDSAGYRDAADKAQHWIRNHISQHERPVDWFCVDSDCEWNGDDPQGVIENYRNCPLCGGYVLSVESLEERAAIMEHDGYPTVTINGADVVQCDRARAEYLAVASALQQFRTGAGVVQPDKAKVKRVLSRWWQLTGAQEAAA